jgi:hypothetical protein
MHSWKQLIDTIWQTGDRDITFALPAIFRSEAALVPPELKHFVQEARFGTDAFHLLPFCVLILTTAQHEDSLPPNASKISIESVDWHRAGANICTGENMRTVARCTCCPKEYTRARRFGGWANTKREAYLELLAKLLDAAEAPLSDRATEFGPFNDPADNLSADSTEETNGGASAERLCKVCGCSLILHSTTEKPSWSRVMDSVTVPAGINVTDGTSGFQVAKEAWQPLLKSITIGRHRVASSDKVQRTIYPCA